MIFSTPIVTVEANVGYSVRSMLSDPLDRCNCDVCLSVSHRKANTFWMSTGMFPQEFIIRFAEPTMVSAVTVDSYNGREEVHTVGAKLQLTVMVSE